VLAVICRSHGADRDLDAGSYKDLAPTEHDLGLPNDMESIFPDLLETGAGCGLACATIENDYNDQNDRFSRE